MTVLALPRAASHPALTSDRSPRIIFLRLTILSAPAYILGVAIGNTYMPLAVVCACIVAGYEATLFAAAPRRASSSAFELTAPFVALVAIGAIALLISPYRADAADRGVRQVAGLGAMTLMIVSVIHLSERRPLDYLRLVRLFGKVAGAVGWIAVVEFAVNNVNGQRIVDFGLIAKITGAFGYWDGGNTSYRVIRATSIASEPSALGLTMGTAFGLAIVRLGIAGRATREALRPLMPRWAALGVAGGLLTSFAFIGYAAVLLCLAAVAMLRAPRRFLLIGGAVLVVAAVAVEPTIVQFISFRGLPMLDRLQFFLDFANAGASAVGSFKTADLDAIIIISNATVALQNLLLDPLVGAGFGAHPVAYFTSVPALAYERGYALNNEDASGLALRLISETGILGLTAFLAGVCYVTIHVQRRLRHSDPLVQALALGLGASLVATTILHLARIGAYYWPPYWVLLGLAAGTAVWRPPHPVPAQSSGGVNP
jgi:hypothetical protein